MKCPNCQAENPEGVKFCGECGQSLSVELTCPRCGHKNPQGIKFCYDCGYSLVEPASTKPPPSAIPTFFAGGRYQVKKFLGEGGKKKVYLAHDTVLDRDIAFYLIKTEKLDEAGQTRIKREAQAMGKLGDHPNIVTIFDFGNHQGQPYMVAPLMAGGDVESLIEKATDHKLPLDTAVEICKSVCRGLEFAHARNVIHRDIKPGNIWLSADGTVKIGDFGLAVSVDMSRLTQEGMMVGTYYYMPPEQAMGGKLTAKADLYSLGAMLYEMVTGRPPFVGDDSVAIIGQHINTSPISPSWHRANLPPALETLIMQLLEKDPEKRPGSATVVLQALESITAGKVKEESVQRATPAENPLYRRVFVGRERELKQLQSTFDGAISGQGALVMVVGEPGIGKTALCEQLSTYVTLRGGKTLWGHCYEKGSLSLPYLAFIEAMRSYVLDREPDDLKKELGSGATDVARIVSEVREKLHVEPREAQNPEEDRYRLMQAVASFLTNAATVKPMLVILEDLHDADKGTLEMLSYVSRSLSETKLLLVGTYRDVEVDRSHPLSAALAELRRGSSFGRVLLRGLNIDEVRRMLESLTQENIPVGLAEAVHRQTEGNPLFVQEVLRYLTEEKLLTRSGDKITTASSTSLEMNIPEGLRDVIGKRLALLSAECNQLLTIAAVIGREFRLDIIQKISTFSEEELFSLLDEAKKASIIEEYARVGSGVIYRFTHAFFRQTLYEETIAPRRIRLHLRIGHALEEVYANRIEEHASELADHFSHSSDSDDLKKAVQYGEIAAQRALIVYAYGEAVRLLEQALKVQDVLESDDKTKRCDLLLTMAEALIYAGNPRHALGSEAPEAFSLAEDISDDRRASKACQLAFVALVLDQFMEGLITPEAAHWAERADRHALPNTIERVWADMMMGTVKSTTGEITEGIRLLTQALELVQRVGDLEIFALTAGFWLTVAAAPQHAEDQLHLAEEVFEQTRGWRGGRWPAGLRAPVCLISAFLMNGQRIHAEEVIREHRDMTERTGQAHDELNVMLFACYPAILDGRLEEALEMVRRMLNRGDDLDLAEYNHSIASLIVPRLQLYLGKAEEGLEEFSKSTVNPFLTTVYLAYLGRDAEVVEMLEQFVLARPGIGSTEDTTPGYCDIQLLEAAVIVGHHQAADLLLNRFTGSKMIMPGASNPTCIARHLGAAAALLERYDEARDQYIEAIRICNEMRFRPELALSRLGLAELLFDHHPDEKAEALEHLDFSIKEFREMKMQPSLERALRRKEILRA